MSNYAIPLFFSMFALAIVWLVLVKWLFHSLAKRHPTMYERIGSPRGFEPEATSALLSFLLTRKPESLGDTAMLVRANVMRAMLAVNIIGFALLVYLVVVVQDAA
jgi:hypothetical protein